MKTKNSAMKKNGRFTRKNTGEIFQRFLRKEKKLLHLISPSRTEYDRDYYQEENELGRVWLSV